MNISSSTAPLYEEVREAFPSGLSLRRSCAFCEYLVCFSFWKKSPSCNTAIFFSCTACTELDGMHFSVLFPSWFYYLYAQCFSDLTSLKYLPILKCSMYFFCMLPQIFMEHSSCKYIFLKIDCSVILDETRLHCCPTKPTQTCISLKGGLMSILNFLE